MFLQSKPHTVRWKLAMLVSKLILVDKVSKVEDMEKAVDNLNGALETYYEKWMAVKTENAEILKKT